MPQCFTRLEKPYLEARFVTLLRDATAQHVLERPSYETWQRAAAAGRWLWVLKGLMAFVPMVQRRRGGAAEDDEDDVDEMTTKYLELQKCFWKNAEMGLWEDLLQEDTLELASTQSSGDGVLATDLSRQISQVHEDADAMKMAARKTGGGGVQGRQVAVGGEAGSTANGSHEQ